MVSFCLQHLFYSTDVIVCTVLWYRKGQGCLQNVCYSILSNCLAVSNRNMYTPDLHIGILDDTTSVKVVGALHELGY